MNKIKSLKEHDGDEVLFYSNDNSAITIYPPKDGSKLIFKHEQYYGECNAIIDRFFIVLLNIDGQEISRTNAISEHVTSIFWKINK